MHDTPALTGLTTAEVAERVADGRVNDVPDAPVRTTSEIFRANVLTPVNAIMGTLFALILIAGFPGDALFAGVIVSNSIIGTVQELRARRTLTNLAVLSAPRARVVRDGAATDVNVSAVVADDLLELRPGDQVVVDGVMHLFPTELSDGWNKTRVVHWTARIDDRLNWTFVGGITPHGHGVQRSL